MSTSGSPLSRITSQPIFWAALACLLGSTVAVCVLGTRVVDPTDIKWLTAGWDGTVGFLGWVYYRRSDWFFPLAYFDTLLYPQGTTTILTDSIPILTVVFKTFESILPESFQYFGLWLVSCVAFMGLSGWLLARVLGYSMPGALAAAALLTLSPPLWDRVVHHHALAMQWCIVLLFYMYFKANSAQNGRFNIVGIVSLNVLAIGVTPYLSAMTLTLTSCCFLNAAVKGGRKNLRWCVMGVLVLALCMAAFMFVLGYFSIRTPGEWGFGYYKTDLFSLVSPNSTSFDSDDNNAKSFSRLLPELMPESTFESHAYIGLAPLILLAISLLRFRPRWFRQAVEKGYLPLIAGVLVLWLYALATPISISGRPIISLGWLYSRLGALPEMFRSSGRFCWPFAYLLITFSLMFIRYWIPRRAVFVLWFLVAFQLWDMFPRLQRIHQIGAKRAAFQIRPLPLPPLSSKLHAYFIPPFSKCPGSKLAEWRSEFDRLAFAVNGARLKFNSGRTARLSKEEALKICEEQTQAVNSGNTDPDGIYIFYANKAPQVGPALNCVREERFWVCQ